MTSKNLSDFKFKKSKTGKLSVFYKNKQLLVFSEKVLFQAILDSAPSYFLKSLVESSNLKPKNSEVDQKIKKFASVYVFEKLKYFKKTVDNLNNKEVIDTTEKLLSDKKNIKYFEEAIEIMNQAGVTNISQFIKAQIDGLKFVNDGQGVFPKPSQLASENALTRLFEFNSSIKKDEKNEKPARYWYFDEKIDGDISLNNNTKYQEAIKKIKNGTADLNATLYAKKCYSRRRDGKTYFLIEDHLAKISE